MLLITRIILIFSETASLHSFGNAVGNVSRAEEPMDIDEDQGDDNLNGRPETPATHKTVDTTPVSTSLGQPQVEAPAIPGTDHEGSTHKTVDTPAPANLAPIVSGK